MQYNEHVQIQLVLFFGLHKIRNSIFPQWTDLHEGVLQQRAPTAVVGRGEDGTLQRPSEPSAASAAPRADGSEEGGRERPREEAGHGADDERVEHEETPRCPTRLTASEPDASRSRRLAEVGEQGSPHAARATCHAPREATGSVRCRAVGRAGSTEGVAALSRFGRRAAALALGRPQGRLGSTLTPLFCLGVNRFGPWALERGGATSREGRTAPLQVEF